MSVQPKKVNKINGYSFKDFEQIGINPKQIYRVAKDKTEKELEKEVFKIKYGKLTGNQRSQNMILYYKTKLLKVKSIYIMDRSKYVRKLRSEVYVAGNLFGMKDELVDKIWTESVKTYLN